MRVLIRKEIDPGLFVKEVSSNSYSMEKDGISLPLWLALTSVVYSNHWMCADGFRTRVIWWVRRIRGLGSSLKENNQPMNPTKRVRTLLAPNQRFEWLILVYEGMTKWELLNQDQSKLHFFFQDRNLKAVIFNNDQGLRDRCWPYILVIRISLIRGFSLLVYWHRLDWFSSHTFVFFM